LSAVATTDGASAPELIPVILSGGSGTRLWPLSRDLRPKQLLPLVGPRTLLQDTVLRTRSLSQRLAPPIVVCSEDHRFLVAEQLREIGVSPRTTVLEPEGRNTAPAVAIAALIATQSAPHDAKSRAARVSAGSVLLVSPADHVILDTTAFAASVDEAIDAARAGYLVTLGIKPDRPETGYGYIERGADRGRWSLVDDFVEKPDLPTAQRYVDSGRYLWNSGMFVCTPSAYLEELERHSPAIYAACVRAFREAAVDDDFTRLGGAFLDCPSDSIDYAVMEKTSKAAVVPLEAGWSDIGSWSALYDVLEKDSDGNVVRGDVVLERCKNSYVLSTNRLVATIGLDGFVVIETPDAVTVLPQREAQSIKAVVERLKGAGRQEVVDISPSSAPRRSDR
jgi:mannose-1-phosphate guanylyltransferase / mannose-6-phosphate isomerase